MFQGIEHPNIESFDFDTFSTVTRIDISDRDAIDFQGETEILRTGKVNAILYWFDLQFSQDESQVFDTFNSWYFNKTCTLLNIHKNVNKGDKFMINVLRMGGYMKLYL